MYNFKFVLVLFFGSAQLLSAQEDWLIDPTSYKTIVKFSQDSSHLTVSNGLIKNVYNLNETVTRIHFENQFNQQSILRAVQPEAILSIQGVSWKVGGKKGQPNQAFFMPAWEHLLKTDSNTFLIQDIKVSPITDHLPWEKPSGHLQAWPPAGKEIIFNFQSVSGHSSSLMVKKINNLTVEVHYAYYDGLPAYSKWLVIRNNGRESIKIDRVTTELVAAVERVSWVESGTIPYPRPLLHVETDYAFGGMSAEVANDHVVHWTKDPDYSSQVHYLRETPCLLQVSPDSGPSIHLDAGMSWTSYRTYVLALDGEDRERNGLAQRRLYRSIAPWTLENPLMMHVRHADWTTVKNAIDQCAETGFEMVILTFGSGFNLENDSVSSLNQYKKYADYAHNKGIRIGGYSLLASRSIAPDQDVIMPDGLTPAFGHSPCLQSEWGLAYFKQLYRFYEYTGFDLLEHDGSYPGDVCASYQHPGHQDLADSQWKQRQLIADFYAWCRKKGIYLNVPDYYYLSGSNKNAMGYREVNWSLPREEQVIHTRQNIYDGTWEKTPSMGWMFVPLTEYHGGGTAATIEPLHEHLDHYEQMITSNLAGGVQACYRGPRLYDTPETKAMVTKWVQWFKAHRQVLEGDIIHMRRADGRDLDYWLHVNPAGAEKALLTVFNPLDHSVTKTIKVPLYYSGLKTKTSCTDPNGKVVSVDLHRDYTVPLEVHLKARGFSWYIFR